MEGIIATAFGRVVEIQKDQSDPLTEAAAKIFAMSSDADKASFIYLILLLSTKICAKNKSHRQGFLPEMSIM